MMSRRALAVLTAAALSGGFALAAPSQASAAPTSLMFSVYIEGSSNNKALEVYNPTGASVDLSDYAVAVYSNGATSPSITIDMTGTLAAGGRWTLAHSLAATELVDAADALTSAGIWNGDDAIQLHRAGVVVDSFGQTGARPAGGWSGGGVATQDRSLVRSGCVVDTDPLNEFDPSAQWTGHPNNTFSVLGTFTCDGSTTPPTDPPTDPPVDPPSDVVAIGAVQGTADIAAMNGKTVTIEGVVTGDFQTGGLNGYFVQDGGDGDAATSDAIFVYAPGGADVAVGDFLRITGPVSEFGGQTQLRANAVAPATGTGPVITPTAIGLPLTSPEARESMLVAFSEQLTILETYNYDRYGELVYGRSRQHNPTSVVEPGSAAADLLATNLANRILVDDGRTNQNPDPAIHPNGREFTRDNYFRAGDTVTDLTGILSHAFNAWRVQPTQGAHHAHTNPRPEVPAVGGDVTVASMNVLNYFTTLTSEDDSARGADNAAEFERQQSKIVAALAAMDADVVGLVEIENNGTAVENLVRALNSRVGGDVYAAINTGRLGDDAIIQALIYKKAVVAPVGDWAALDYQDGLNRPTLLQTFREIATGETFNVAVSHLKSKGSACEEPDQGDGAGNCNAVRLAAAKAMATWLAGDPTGQGEDRTLILGDLNSYTFEDPIDALVEAGFANLLHQFKGTAVYSYVFDGMTGYLDHALSSSPLTPYVTGAAAWNINADESDLFDYQLNFKSEGQQALWGNDPYRSSDHDPVLVGLLLTEPEEEVPPTKPTPPPTKPTPPVVRPGLPSTGR